MPSVSRETPDHASPRPSRPPHAPSRPVSRETPDRPSPRGAHRRTRAAKRFARNTGRTEARRRAPPPQARTQAFHVKRGTEPRRPAPPPHHSKAFHVKRLDRRRRAEPGGLTKGRRPSVDRP